MDGNTAVVMCERESSDAAGAYPITPSTQMGEYWAAETAAGHLNISGRPLVFIEPEGEHAAAAVTAGLSLTGMRSTNFSSGQGIAYMHESLYAAVGKRLTYVLNMGCRAMTKATLNVHAAHDDYHAIDDTGFFQLFAKGVQEAADLNVIAHRIAELALNPGIVAQDGFLTTHVMESIRLPERELIAEYLGRPDDWIDCPTPAQRMLFGQRRRRIPVAWDVDNARMLGTVQNQESYMQSVAAQRPYFFAHLPELTDMAMREFAALTGRAYARVMAIHPEADYLIIGQGSVVANAEAVSEYLSESRGLRIGVVNLVMFRPFPADLLGILLKGRKGVTVLERVDQPLAVDQPLMREIRATLSRCLENSLQGDAFPGYATIRPEEMPRLYSGSFGLGSRDLQPGDIIGAVENMLPGGRGERQFYLSIDFLSSNPAGPKGEIANDSLRENYPDLAKLTVKGSENPGLMPEGSIAVRIHSVGGWGAMATGKNLTMTLATLLDFHVKANPRYGSEKKGQPTTYYLAVAPQPIAVNCEFHFVDAVLSPDPHVFSHSNPLAGLRKKGIFIIQSDLGDPDQVWESIPAYYQKVIVKNEIQLYYLDAFKIARAEATDAELQYRMQGMAFQGAFFQATRDLEIFQKKGLTEAGLFQMIEQKLEQKFGSKGRRIVEDNLRVVLRGYQECRLLEHRPALTGSDIPPAVEAARKLPIMLKSMPQSKDRESDIHHFWEDTGMFYRAGNPASLPASPSMAVSAIPASTGVFKDMTEIRFEVPQWKADRCTGCGHCWTACPDTAIPGLVHEVGEIFFTVVSRLQKKGHSCEHLQRVLRPLEKRLYQLCKEGGEEKTVLTHLDRALEEQIAAEQEIGREALRREVQAFREEWNGFDFALTRPFFTLPDEQQPGKGGLLSITINPYTCKGCMECVAVCSDDALVAIPQTRERTKEQKAGWDFWLDLPEVQERFQRIDDLEEGVGALETLLLNKSIYNSMSGGDGACLGCAEKTVLHLFTATVTALMQKRVKQHLIHIQDLIEKLERQMQQSLLGEINPRELEAALASIHKEEVHAFDLSARLAQGEPLDVGRLKELATTVTKLKELHSKYTEGITGQGRTALGAVNATGCSSVWGSTYPINPYPFPWVNHLFQDAPSMAMGVFEGHMQKMADGFKTIRLARWLANPVEKRPDFTYLTWRDFTEEEYLLCPPLAVIGGDGALYDIGFQNLSRLMMSGMPVKVLALDTQVYSNTGGQACTSGFTGQISDMAAYGRARQGKEEIRKEIALIAIAHRTSYVLQGSQASVGHLLEGFIEGLRSRRPALFNVYCNCPPEHGTADDVATRQARLALESRAYPLIKYNPDRGPSLSECLDLSGNPDLDQDWPAYDLKYLSETGQEETLRLPVTFADFALTEARFARHFRTAPRESWNASMIPLIDYLDKDSVDREGLFPFIWAISKKQELIRVIVSEMIVQSCEDRRNYFRMLKNIARLDLEPFDEQGLRKQVQSEMIERFTNSLVALARKA